MTSPGAAAGHTNVWAASPGYEFGIKLSTFCAKACVLYTYQRLCAQNWRNTQAGAAPGFIADKRGLPAPLEFLGLEFAKQNRRRRQSKQRVLQCRTRRTSSKEKRRSASPLRMFPGFLFLPYLFPFFKVSFIK